MTGFEDDDFEEKEEQKEKVKEGSTLKPKEQNQRKVFTSQKTGPEELINRVERYNESKELIKN